jgi:hypothetical protein
MSDKFVLIYKSDKKPMPKLELRDSRSERLTMMVDS